MKRYIFKWGLIGLIIGLFYISYYSTKGSCDFDESIFTEKDCKISLIKATLESGLTYIVILVVTLFGAITGFIKWKIKNKSN